MTHTYDWSKLDAGWRYCAHELPGPSLCLNGTSYWTLEFLERDEMSLGSEHMFARAQLAKCRIALEPEPSPEYDWSKLDRGWQYSVMHDALLLGGSMMLVKNAEAFSGGTECDQFRFATAVKAQLAKCRIRDTEPAPQPYSKFPTPTGDNTALFDAMDKMAAEVPAEEWAKVPPIGNCATERFGCTPCPACGKHGLHLCEKFYPEPPSTKWFHPSQPWRRGPLATWTLVNISNHDGRLTVVMRRGRSEVLIETGSDDETLWERLGKKAVEADKAKSKEKCDV